MNQTNKREYPANRRNSNSSVPTSLPPPTPSKVIDYLVHPCCQFTVSSARRLYTEQIIFWWKWQIGGPIITMCQQRTRSSIMRITFGEMKTHSGWQEILSHDRTITTLSPKNLLPGQPKVMVKLFSPGSAREEQQFKVVVKSAFRVWLSPTVEVFIRCECRVSLDKGSPPRFLPLTLYRRAFTQTRIAPARLALLKAAGGLIPWASFTTHQIAQVEYSHPHASLLGKPHPSP